MIGRNNDPEKLSKNPAQIRRRLRRHQGRIDADVTIYAREVYQKPLEEWDLEELARGRPRNKDGNFTGRPPTWLNITVQREARRRLLEHAFGGLANYVDLAIKSLVNMIECDEVDLQGKPIIDARTKLQACMFIIEHVIGKPKAVVEINGTEEKRAALAAAIVLDDGKPQDDPIVLEGEYEEGEEEEVENNE